MTLNVSVGQAFLLQSTGKRTCYNGRDDIDEKRASSCDAVIYLTISLYRDGKVVNKDTWSNSRDDIDEE